MSNLASEMSFAARVDERERMMLQAISHAGWWMSPDGRIGERDAAALLGYGHPDSFRNARRRADPGGWPRVFRLGGNGNKLTYQVRDLAEFVERKANPPAETYDIFRKVNRAGSALSDARRKLA
jgi:nicotinamidase-related amidase